jgi:anaerobic magnesium-protoporphyrin IX monomethyl ester cyclase
MKPWLFLVPPSKAARNVARDLVYGCWCKGKRIAGIQFPPLSQLSCLTVLRRAGIAAELLDAAALGLKLEQLKAYAPHYEVVVILTSSVSLKEDILVFKFMQRANPELKLILWGGYVTAEPETALLHSGAAAVVRGEGEYILRDLALNWEGGGWKEVPGISYLEKAQIFHNKDYPWIADLDELPIPDRSLLPKGVDYFNPIVKRMPYTTAFTSRGCPGECSFCASPSFYGKRLRLQSAARVLQELELISQQGYKEVFFRDETFTASKARVQELCSGIIQQRLNLSWICSARVGSLTLELMQLMRQAGCHMLRLGVECGVQELLDAVKKGITLQETRQTFVWAKQVGLDTHAHLMIGLPGETKQTLQTTLNFILELEPTIVTLGILTPYPGTPLFAELKAQHPEIGEGLAPDLSSLHTTSFYNKYFMELQPEELSDFIRYAYRSFYLRPAYIWKWLKRIQSWEEFKRVMLAATQVFSFIGGGG